MEKFALAAASHPDHNILVDLRDTVVTAVNMTDLMRLALDMALYGSLLRNKIANVVPGDDERLAIAENFKVLLEIEGFEYDFFTDYEAAIEWLSETTQLP